VKVYLLLIDQEQHVFYAEDPEEGEPAASIPRRGVLGWLERLVRRLGAAVPDWESGVGARTRRIRDWLQRRAHPDESLLARLRTAAAIQVVHPAAMNGDAARAAWDRYLASRERRHWPWLVGNALISPWTLLLMPLPGPNLIGYWFVYRAVHHLLVIVGVKRVRHGKVETSFHPCDALDEPIGSAEEGPMARAAGRCGARPRSEDGTRQPCGS
jgi:hypothetical protein